ncbi:MAG: enoyl-CoA hydratase/isomerase family protein [Desulfobacteraceae bacterium]|nr:enoyl-CoA hydratase/isomerase family protein [Desulfobacteraceae bacterium]
MKPSEFKELVYEKEKTTGIVTVTMNMPKRKNAQSLYTFLEFWWAADAFTKDENAHAMIITGTRDPENPEPSKEAFSSGGYFNPDAYEGLEPEVMDQIDFADIAQKRVVEKFWYVDKPVIAAINGLAIGGGITLALGCCDLIYISEQAWIRFPFVRLGITPELASSFLLPRLIGLQRTKELFYFGEDISAQYAFEMGLVNKVLPHEELLAYAREQALRLIPPNGPVMAVRLTKQILHRQLAPKVQRALDEENIALGRSLKSADFMEAITARIEKRAPVFKGK